ncbi:MAG: DUF3445 domain-containing protein, partial [Verrucomicrobia bacterium]|nr:DUF3445 domain-containing protein [Verrucomicrobiota bacterium]
MSGCVCFPTGWSLEEKQGRTLSFAHAPAPGLNGQLGERVERFFLRLKPEECYQRSNWSLTSSSQLNQRPQDNIAEIGPDCEPDQTFLRVEWQALILIDPLRVLFGIPDLSPHPGVTPAAARSRSAPGGKPADDACRDAQVQTVGAVPRPNRG